MIQFILDLATTTYSTIESQTTQFILDSETTTHLTIESQTTMHGKQYSLFLKYFDKTFNCGSTDLI